jgi:hypothetical protein
LLLLCSVLRALFFGSSAVLPIVHPTYAGSKAGGDTGLTTEPACRSSPGPACCRLLPRPLPTACRRSSQLPCFCCSAGNRHLEVGCLTTPCRHSVRIILNRGRPRGK